MSLSATQLQNKRRKKSVRRGTLRKKRQHLLNRFGSVVGQRVYEFERTFKNKKVGKKPRLLVTEMMEADRSLRPRQEKYLLVSETTGDWHRRRRRERMEKA